MLVDLEASKASHKTEAGAACEMYKLRIANQRDDYLTLCSAYVTFLHSESAEALNCLVNLASKFSFGIDSDYQQDKATPFWGKSPQPGPTYLFSKETNYLHIIVTHACGDSDGPTRLNRSYFYIRTQQCAGSKDCNDTVYTIFDLLAAPIEPPCAQPKLFRRGYDAAGVFEVTAPAEEAPAEEALA